MAGESGGCADVLYSAIRGRASVSGSQCARGSWRGCDTVLVHDRAPWQPHAPVARGRKPTRAVRRLLLSLLDLACTGCCVRVAHSQAGCCSPFLPAHCPGELGISPTGYAVRVRQRPRPRQRSFARVREKAMNYTRTRMSLQTHHLVKAPRLRVRISSTYPYRGIS